MKILHLVNHCRRGHGNVHLAVDLACVQASRGDAVWYAAEGGELLDVLLHAGVYHIDLCQQTKNPLAVASAALALRRLVLEFSIDIVHAHMMTNAVLGYAATRGTPARLVTTVHNSFDGHSGLMRLGDGVVAVSDAERKGLVSRGFSNERIATIRNATLGGCREAALEPVRALALPRPAITTVCGLHERKGVDILIEAFAAIAAGRDVFLNIVGDGPDRAGLESQAARTGFADRIRFHGSLDDPRSVLEASDIFALASRAEPLGLVNIEARRAGCAILATNVGGIPEALDDGAAGILVPIDDVAAFSRSLARLLDDPDHLATMRQRSGIGLERFAIDVLYSEHDAFYRTVLEKF